jgi:exosortase
MSRNLSFLFFNIITLVTFYAPMKELVLTSFHNELYSHIILIPLVSSYLIFSRRKTVFSEVKYSYIAGIVLITAGTLLYLVGRNNRLGFNQNDYLAFMMFSALIFWTGGFVMLYGIQSFKNATFPLLFLIFMIPIPTVVVKRIILLLQTSSAETVYGLFKLTGVPFLREGFTFYLPQLSIEVAEQCSGIRSSLALFITSILAGHLFLKTGWRKVVLILFVFPITVFKNGLRIATISLLGAYVDERILHSSLHKQGGIPFFILALVFLTPVLWLLKKTEKTGIKK